MDGDTRTLHRSSTYLQPSLANSLAQLHWRPEQILPTIALHSENSIRGSVVSQFTSRESMFPQACLLGLVFFLQEEGVLYPSLLCTLSFTCVQMSWTSLYPLPSLLSRNQALLFSHEGKSNGSTLVRLEKKNFMAPSEPLETA